MEIYSLYLRIQSEYRKIQTRKYSVVGHFSRSDNLTKGERTALKEVEDRNYIIIKKADKGGAVVIIDVKDYLKEAEHQLNNKDAYKKLQHNPTKIHGRFVNDAIACFGDDILIPENIGKGLQVQQP